MNSVKPGHNGQEKPTEDPACLDAVATYLGKLSSDLSNQYDILLAQEPEKLAPIDQLTDYLIRLAGITGKRDQLAEMQSDFGANS